MKLRQMNRINLIKSNVIHKSESEQTIKNGILSASNQKNLEKPVNKPLKDDVVNFNAPLSRRQSEKFLVNMNSINTNINPIFIQPLRTPSNSNKNLIEIPENNNINCNTQCMNNNFNNNDKNKLINLASNSKSMNLDTENYNYEIRNSNNRIPNLNQLSNNINSNNYEKRNSYSNNNMIKLNNNNNQIEFPARIMQNHPSQNEHIFRSNNNIVKVHKSMGLFGGESVISKSDNNVKSRSNPLLQYITIGIKSNGEFKRLNVNAGMNASSNRSSRRRAGNSVINGKSNVNAFSVYTSSAAENSKKILEKGIFVVKDNYKTILALFLLLGGGAYVFKIYKENPRIFWDMKLITIFLPNVFSKSLEKFFNAEFIKENVFTVCILTALLIALVFIVLKYREHVRFNKIAEQDYSLIKQILEASRHKENNCDLIGLFENNFVKDNSERHKINEETYRRRILPVLHEARLKDDLIEEGEILIQDQAQKVWRLMKDNIRNSSNQIIDDAEITNDF